jgi:hypothetical protein
MVHVYGGAPPEPVMVVENVCPTSIVASGHAPMVKVCPTDRESRRSA